MKTAEAKDSGEQIHTSSMTKVLAGTKFWSVSFEERYQDDLAPAVLIERETDDERPLPLAKPPEYAQWNTYATVQELRDLATALTCVADLYDAQVSAIKAAKAGAPAAKKRPYRAAR